MLDFGSQMPPAKERNDSDDLFGDQELEKSENIVPQSELDLLSNSVKADDAEKSSDFEAEDNGADKSEKKIFQAPKAPVLPKMPEPKEKTEEPVKAVLRNNPHLLHRKRKSEEFSESDKLEVSKILKNARAAAGYSPDDVEKLTQIRAMYLIALEEADYDQLPQQVYVLAYLRRLCDLYDIRGDEEARLVGPWRNVRHELPENLPASVQQDDEVENSKLLHWLEIGVLAGGAIIIIGIITFIVIFCVSFFGDKRAVKVHFDDNTLLELQENPQLIVPAQAPVTRKRR